MTEDLEQSVAAELARIGELPVEEQPAAYEALRVRLEAELNETPIAD